MYLPNDLVTILTVVADTLRERRDTYRRVGLDVAMVRDLSIQMWTVQDIARSLDGRPAYIAG